MYEEAESDIMNQPPRDKKKKLVDGSMVCYGYIQLGIWYTVLMYGMYFFAMW